MTLLAFLIVWAGYSWTVPQPVDWKVEQPAEGAAVLHLLTGREPPSTGPRKPFQFAVADAGPFQHVVVEADVRPLARSLMLVYAYQDAAHFDYAHLSVDSAMKEPHHNGVFHVYGGERVRISDVAGPAAFRASKEWYHVRLEWDGADGLVQVQVDGQAVPALRAVDLSLKSGKVGVGSFDETADFRNVRIHGS
ncbi:MAG TPA: hypothetical protein VH351_06975 [Bryobacteraceae bacterium]|jgi:hypothetical protein|nr:hypothetical protein [Bryobacteraceae bacterium]